MSPTLRDEPAPTFTCKVRDLHQGTEIFSCAKHRSALRVVAHAVVLELLQPEALVEAYPYPQSMPLRTSPRRTAGKARDRDAIRVGNVLQNAPLQSVTIPEPSVVRVGRGAALSAGTVILGTESPGPPTRPSSSQLPRRS